MVDVPETVLGERWQWPQRRLRGDASAQVSITGPGRPSMSRPNNKQRGTNTACNAAYNPLMVQSSNPSDNTPTPRLAAVSVAAMGVVYGDIGTSPLYTMREVFNGPHAVAVTNSLVLQLAILTGPCDWQLVIVTTSEA